MAGLFSKVFMLDDKKLLAKYRREKFPTRDRLAQNTSRAENVFPSWAFRRVNLVCFFAGRGPIAGRALTFSADNSL
jgi:hypothetical protein